MTLGVCLGNLDELALEDRHVDTGTHRVQLGLEIAPFLDEPKLFHRVCLDDFGLDLCQSCSNRVGGALAATLGLVGAKSFQILTYCSALGATGSHGCLVVIRQRVLGSFFRHEQNITEFTPEDQIPKCLCLESTRTNPGGREGAGSVIGMDLGALFDLTPAGPDAFTGAGPRYPWGGLYGGQIVAQALRAATNTVADDLLPHSLRAYFIRRGDNTELVRYEVDRIRDGKSFCTRRVVARQANGAILNLETSFQRPEAGADITTVTMPTGLPDPESLKPSSWSSSFDRRQIPWRSLDDHGRTGTGRVAMWMKVTDAVVDDPLLHRCWLAYLSDDLPTDSVRRALSVMAAPGWPALAHRDDEPEWDGSFGASLDHTVWFHRPMRADQWHLYDFSCHGFIGGRGLSIGHVFTADGVHAATVTQEVLLRRARPGAPG